MIFFYKQIDRADSLKPNVHRVAEAIARQSSHFGDRFQRNSVRRDPSIRREKIRCFEGTNLLCWRSSDAKAVRLQPVIFSIANRSCLERKTNSLSYFFFFFLKVSLTKKIINKKARFFFLIPHIRVYTCSVRHANHYKSHISYDPRNRPTLWSHCSVRARSSRALLIVTRPQREADWEPKICRALVRCPLIVSRFKFHYFELSKSPPANLQSRNTRYVRHSNFGFGNARHRA